MEREHIKEQKPRAKLAENPAKSYRAQPGQEGRDQSPQKAHTNVGAGLDHRCKGSTGLSTADSSGTLAFYCFLLLYTSSLDLNPLDTLAGAGRVKWTTQLPW